MADAPLVLVAHGSRDVRSPATVRRLAAAVRRRWDAPVASAFLDFNLPAVPAVLRGLCGGGGLRGGDGDAGGPVVVPALLTRAYHGKVDVPAMLAAAGVPTRLTPVLGPEAPGEEPHPLLVAAMVRQVDQLKVPYDGVVLLAAGTRDEAARSTVDLAARALGEALRVPCVAGYATAPAQAGSAAVAALRARGAGRIVGAAYFLAPGRLYDRVAASALAGAALAVADPLGDAPELADLVVSRALAAPRELAAAA